MSAPDKSDGPRRRAFPWKRLWFPLGAVGLFAVIGAAYYTLQVTSQQRYFTERAFRILAFQDGTLSNGADGMRSVFSSSSFYTQNGRLVDGLHEQSAKEYLEDNLASFGLVNGTIVTRVTNSDHKQHRDGVFRLMLTDWSGGLRVRAQYRFPKEQVAPAEGIAPCTVFVDALGGESTPACFFAQADFNLETNIREAIESTNEQF
ncbi:MAG TPA: hypothetical protein VEG63_12175, partial [Candidatus Acidoferrales bacterium]|nr:hypothetical protein [Candidatus Acidoferrales bacterium]